MNVITNLKKLDVVTLVKLEYVFPNNKNIEFKIWVSDKDSNGDYSKFIEYMSKTKECRIVDNVLYNLGNASYLELEELNKGFMLEDYNGNYLNSETYNGYVYNMNY